MIPLEAVLWTKIVATVVLWALPLLLVPARTFPVLGFPRPEPPVFVKLLGVAFVSLLVCYGQGLWALRSGAPAGQDVVASTVLVGKVSNGISCVLLVGYGMRGAYRSWGRLARLYIQVSVLVTALVTLGLFVAR